jgi:hypothetical protein
MVGDGCDSLVPHPSARSTISAFSASVSTVGFCYPSLFILSSFLLGYRLSSFFLLPRPSLFASGTTLALQRGSSHLISSNINSSIMNAIIRSVLPCVGLNRRGVQLGTTTLAIRQRGDSNEKVSLEGLYRSDRDEEAAVDNRQGSEREEGYRDERPRGNERAIERRPDFYADGESDDKYAYQSEDGQILTTVLIPSRAAVIITDLIYLAEETVSCHCSNVDSCRCSASLDRRVASVVDQAGGWSRHLAELILRAMEKNLWKIQDSGSMIGGEEYQVRDAAYACRGFDDEYPLPTAIYTTVIALGLLVHLAPIVLEVLGFGEFEPVEGKQCPSAAITTLFLLLCLAPSVPFILSLHSSVSSPSFYPSWLWLTFLFCDI